MRKVLFITTLILLAGCSGQHKKLNKIIEKSTRVEVFVFDKGSNQNGAKAYESTDPARIKQFEAYFTDKHTPQYQCGYSGKVVFSSEKKNINIMFNMDSNCTHIAYMIDYNLYTMELSKKGLEFLKTVTANLPQKPVQQQKTETGEEAE
jgi:hypothetical protein